MVRLDASEYVAEETEVPEVAEYSEEYSDEYSEECSDPLRYVLSETLLSRVPVLPLLPVLSVSESVPLLPPLSVLWLSKKRDIVGDMAGSGLTARCRAMPPPRALGGILTSTRLRSVLDVLARMCGKLDELQLDDHQFTRRAPSAVRSVPLLPRSPCTPETRVDNILR